MHFQKQDLKGTHYHWPEGNNEMFNGQPSRRIFDPFNGEQMLFMINFYGSLSDRFSLQEGKIIEYELSYNLPSTMKSEVSVFNWMRSLQLTGK